MPDSSLRQGLSGPDPGIIIHQENVPDKKVYPIISALVLNTHTTVKPQFMIRGPWAGDLLSVSG